MFKSETISNARNDQRDRRFDISFLNFGFVSDLELRISDFHSPRHRGFSFTEIMFAVVILGIGFIMVAAIFPVALQQSKSTAEEINAAGIARGAANYAGQIFSDDAVPNPNPPNPNPFPGRSNLQATGTTALPSRPVVAQIPVELNPPTPGQRTAWDLLRGDMFMTEDPRYAYVMLYRRDGDITQPQSWAPYAQVYVFPVQVRNKERFSADDTVFYNTGLYAGNFVSANLMAHRVNVLVGEDDAGVSLLAFDSSVSGLLQTNIEAAAEGAYVVVANDNISAPATSTQDDRGRMNGRIYRLGVRREDMDSDTTVFPATVASKVVYELAPGSEFVSDPGADGIFGSPTIPNDPHFDDDITAVGMNCFVVDNGTKRPNSVVASPAQAFVIGRGYRAPFDPLVQPPGFDGPAMPISAYTTFVKVQ